MKSKLKLSILILSTLLSAGTLLAQDEAAPPSGSDNKSENIIIHKKNSTSEKVTIVIDGDKITVNGKPVEDYKSDDVDIINLKSLEPRLKELAMAAPQMANNGMQMLGNDFMREIHNNKALLGVMTKNADNGVAIIEVTKESAAEKAGLKQGDVITKINEDKISSPDDLYKAVGNYKPSDKINVTYNRDGKENTVSVELAENKQVRTFAWKNGDNNDNFNFAMPPGSFNLNGFINDRPRLGLQVQDTEDRKGVKVLDADKDEAGYKGGLKEDDIITAIDGKQIGSVDDLQNQLKDVKKGDTVKVTFLRENKTQTADIKFPKDLKTTDL